MSHNARTIKLLVAALFASALTLAAQANNATTNSYEINLPSGISAELWAYFVPKNNPMTAAKVELGRQLFFDKRLSVDGTVSCASCHDPELAFADGKRVSEGVAGRRGARNSPSLLNAMFNSAQFWDGRAATLEAQATEPLINPDEMGNQSLSQVTERLAKLPEYAAAFRRVFNTEVTAENLAKAIAAFERTLVAADSPYDRFLAGDREAMSEAARRGLAVFRLRARCNVCHNINPSFPFFTDNSFRNTGVAANHRAFESLAQRAAQQPDAAAATRKALAAAEGGAELGRFATTGNALDIGAFRTPSLRNVELTAPYFHDGSAATLADVVRYYIKGGNDNGLRDWELQALELTDDEQRDLIEFLKALTSLSARRPSTRVTTSPQP